MNRNDRINIARDTLCICKSGFYLNNNGKEISIKNELAYAVQNTRLYSPGDEPYIRQELNLELSKNTINNTTTIEVENETTLHAAERLYTKEDYSYIACLNFASAKNPGGGFLKGSNAQEESLARSSGLYPTIIQMSELYETNRKTKTCLYTDYMIYSPDVPVFRDDYGNLLNEPYYVSFITAPAVNAGIVRAREPENVNRIEETMKKRIEKILSLGIIHGNQAMILGAYGCGVFRNNPVDIAEYFAEFLLLDKRFRNKYHKIIFAVLDSSDKKDTYKVFYNRFC